MAPKGSKKTKKDDKLAPPLVSETALATARQALQTESERKKQRANMQYYLETKGLKAEYGSWPTAQKRAFFESWFADRLSKGATSSNLVKTITVQKTTAENYSWMGEETMTTALGAEKAKAKIDSGKLATRPDRDTGKTCRWSIEYKIYVSEGGDLEVDKHDNILENNLEFDDATSKMGALAEHETSRNCLAGNEPKVDIKIEPGTEEASPQVIENEKTFKGLQTDARKVLRNVGELITTLKLMFTETANSKYTTEVHNDTKALIPKFSSAHRKVEDLVTATTPVNDDAVLMAMAKVLDSLYEKYNDVRVWYEKLAPKAKKSKKEL
jgi:hypothetical protein